MPPTPYAELHCHTAFSFLDGASSADDLVERALELGLTGLAVTDHQGLYGAVRFVTAAEAAGLHPVVGVEISLLDAVVPDPAGIVVPAPRGSPRRGGRRDVVGPSSGADLPPPVDGLPARPRPVRRRPPGHRAVVREDLRGIGDGQRGPHLVLLARDGAGYRSLCRLVSRANLSGTKGVPRFTQALLADHAEGIVVLSGCRHGEIARRLRVGDREGARAVAERYARLFGRDGAGGGGGPGAAGPGLFLELQHHLLPDDDWLVAETAGLAAELGLPVVVTNDVHYARPEDRELQDVLTAIRHGRTLDTLADLRRPDGESYLKAADDLAGLAAPDDEPTARAWAEGLTNAGELAAACSVDLGFERYRFPGFRVPDGETPFSQLEQLCHEGARRRYHPMTPAVVRQLAHELDVIERTGLAEFFLICWDLMRFAKSRGIPAQGRGSAADSIVAYVLGITRVDPIRHRLLFERFINEGRTSYPDVDIDFSSERREEVIQYVYERYGPEHTGMVCNVVTYRARSAVREVGYALGFPRPLVDRVAKALETYDSVMVRRDLEAEGGFAQFFARPGEAGVPTADVADGAMAAGERGLVDRMGRLSHVRAGGGGAGPDDGLGAGTGPAAPTGAGTGAGSASPSAPVVPEGLSGRVRGLHDADRASLGHSDGRRGRPLVLDRTPGRPEPGPVRYLQAGRPAEDGPGNPSRNTAGDSGPASAAGSPPADAPLADAPSRPGPAAASAYVAAYRLHRYDEHEGMPEGRAAAPGPPFLSTREPRRSGGGAGPTDKGAPPMPSSGLSAAPPLDGAVGAVPTGPGLRPSSGTLPGAGPAPAIRGGGTSDDEGGPGDSPASVAWLRDRMAGRLPGTVDGRRIDPESGVLEAPARRTDGIPAGRTDDTRGRHSSVARVVPEPPPQARGGSTRGMSDWDRWLEFCARIDGFPRHLSIHSGGMLVTAAPLIDIAPLERATMADRVVVQYDKRDVEALRLIKLDLLGLGMLAAIDETLRLIEADCAVCVDLDRLPEDVPEVFAMLRAADTVGVFQVESRAQMQTLPKSRPANLDDLVVEVAIIRPGPIQGNAVHPYLRRKQGLEPVAYLHPSLEPILRDSLGVILYQEQVMQIAIDVAGFSPAESDGFRRAMGTWRSTREMEKLHARFVDGCRTANGLAGEQAEELFRQVAAFASFGFAKSHAAAFARTAYESAFLKLFYPAQFVVGLINAQPMGFYPVEVLVNDAKRHGVTVLPVDVNASSYRTTTEWVGVEGPLPPGADVDRRPEPVRSPACVVPDPEARTRWAAESATAHAIRLGLHLVKGIGEEHADRLDAELARSPYRSLADIVARTGLSEEVVERLIRAGALDSLGRPRRELLWQLREVAGAAKGRVDGRPAGAARTSRRAAGRPMDLRLPPTPAPVLPPIGEVERLGDAYAVLSLDARRQVVGLFREALDRLGAVPNSALAEHRPGPVRIGGLVVTRQHPMTARGTVFLALEDETGMVNVTLWPDAWARLRGVVRRHALLLVDGTLQRESEVVNVVAREVRALPEATAAVGGPARPTGVRQLGHAGMRRA